MKQKGNICLINHTVYDWIKTYQKNYKMVQWHFPEIIPAQCTVDITIEWDERPTPHAIINDGLANYMLFGSRDRLFQIQASSNNSHDIQIHFLNLMTSHLPIGSIIDLDWEESEHVHFKLSGTADEFFNESNHFREIAPG